MCKRETCRVLVVPPTFSSILQEIYLKNVAFFTLFIVLIYLLKLYVGFFCRHCIYCHMKFHADQSYFHFSSEKDGAKQSKVEKKPAKKGKELKVLDPKTGQNLCKAHAGILYAILFSVFI